jgi:outer membrane receptor protein involved in Fe transport
VRRIVAWSLSAGLAVVVTLSSFAQTQDGVSPTVVSDVLQGKDGVRIQTLCTHCNSANIQLGGLSRELVPLWRDGFPIVGGLQTSLVLSMLPADSIAMAEVARGPGDASQSNAAAGGEIDLTSSSPAELPLFDVFAETGSYSLKSATTRLSGALSSSASGAIVLGATEADPIDDDNDGWTDVPAVDRRFAEAELELTPGDDHEIRLGGSFIHEDNPLGRGAFDAVRYVTGGEDGWTREDMGFQRREMRAGWAWRTPHGGTLRLSALAADREQNVRSQLTAVSSGFIEGSDRLIDRFEIDERDMWSSLSYSHPVDLRWRIEGGIEISRQDVDAVSREPLTIIGGGDPVAQRARESVELASAYLTVGLNPGQAWDVEFGLRRDSANLRTELSTDLTSSQRTDSETSPRIRVRYSPARTVTLRLLAGATFRPPRPILAEVCCGQRYQTNENEVPERGRTVAFEFEFAPTPKLRVGAYIARTDFEEHVLRVVGFSQVFIQTYALANIPRSTADRAELTLRWSPSRVVTVDGSVGWLSFENTGQEYVDVHVAPPSFGGTIVVPIRIDRVPYLPVRSGAVAANWTLPKRTTLSVQAGYTGAMSIQQFTRLPSNSELNTEEMRQTPPFWLIHLSAGVPLNRHVSLIGTINNVGNRIQDDLGDPTTDYNWGPLAGRSWRAAVRVRLDR